MTTSLESSGVILETACMIVRICAPIEEGDRGCIVPLRENRGMVDEIVKGTEIGKEIDKTTGTIGRNENFIAKNAMDLKY